MTNIDNQADLLTTVQTALREARDKRDGAKLRQGNELMQGADFARLPAGARIDCSALYREAFFAVSGGLA